MIFIWQLFLVAILGVWFYSLYKLGQTELDRNQKLVWVLLIIFMPLVGAIAFLLVNRNSKKVS